MSRDCYGNMFWPMQGEMRCQILLMHGEMRCQILLRLCHGLATARHTSMPSAPQSSLVLTPLQLRRKRVARLVSGNTFLIRSGALSTIRVLEKGVRRLWSNMQNPCMRCGIGFLFVLTWVGDCKTNFETLCTAVLMSFIQGWSCRPVDRCVDLLPDGMVDLIFDPMHTRRFGFIP